MQYTCNTYTHTCTQGQLEAIHHIRAHRTMHTHAIHIHIRAHRTMQYTCNTHTYTCTQNHSFTCNTHTHTCTQDHAYTCNTHTYTCSQDHAFTCNTHTHMCTQDHAYTCNTHTHTCTQVQLEAKARVTKALNFWVRKGMVACWQWWREVTEWRLQMRAIASSIDSKIRNRELNVSRLVLRARL